MLNDPHMQVRHWQFIVQSIADLNEQLTNTSGQVFIIEGEILKVLQNLKHIGLSHIFSHQEIGLSHTYSRDKRVLNWCEENNIVWQESPYGAVKRPLNNRTKWRKHWYGRISGSVNDPALEKIQWAELPKNYHTALSSLPDEWRLKNAKFQPGGEKRAWYTLHDFFKERGKRYFGNIGKPEMARQTCSRLSPYLAWGNMSIKQAYQHALQHRQRTGWKRSVEAFCSRLSWHCHFIQKFESEHEMEQRSVNHAYEQYTYDESEEALTHLTAWKTGATGIPIIDASMRALQQTGYINFRMRAMLVSFLCHHLNLNWQLGVVHLGSLFLDFEPGIHYPQFQMQAGITGTNTIRIYNPIKQSQEKDPDGVFIKKWLPELKDVPNEFIHEPHKIPPLDAAMINFDIVRDYSLPMIDVQTAAKAARDRLWAFRKRDDVKAEAKRILYAHSVLN
jgi:deoxyribodipyrimidine photo-lyase